LPLIKSGRVGRCRPAHAKPTYCAAAKFPDLTVLSHLASRLSHWSSGNSTRWAYVPACRTRVMVDRGQGLLGGPPLVKMQPRGVRRRRAGRACMHSRVSGLADYFAVDEVDCIGWAARSCRPLLRKLGPGPSRPVASPATTPTELLGVVSADGESPLTPARVIARCGRGRLRRVQAALRDQPGSPRAARPRLPHRHPGQRGGPVQRGGQEASEFILLANRQTPAALPSQHDRLHGGQGVRAAWHDQGRRQDDQRCHNSTCPTATQ